MILTPDDMAQFGFYRACPGGCPQGYQVLQ